MLGTVMITNGYARDEKSFRNNGRVKRARIETSGGYKSEITLKDERRPQADASSSPLGSHGFA